MSTAVNLRGYREHTSPSTAFFFGEETLTLPSTPIDESTGRWTLLVALSSRLPSSSSSLVTSFFRRFFGGVPSPSGPCRVREPRWYAQVGEYKHTSTAAIPFADFLVGFGGGFT